MKLLLDYWTIVPVLSNVQRIIGHQGHQPSSERQNARAVRDPESRGPGKQLCLRVVICVGFVFFPPTLSIDIFATNAQTGKNAQWSISGGTFPIARAVRNGITTSNLLSHQLMIVWQQSCQGSSLNTNAILFVLPRSQHRPAILR